MNNIKEYIRKKNCYIYECIDAIIPRYVWEECQLEKERIKGLMLEIEFILSFKKLNVILEVR